MHQPKKGDDAGVGPEPFEQVGVCAPDAASRVGLRLGPLARLPARSRAIGRGTVPAEVQYPIGRGTVPAAVSFAVRGHGLNFHTSRETRKV